MKEEYKNLVEKFELYKKFLEGRFINGAFNPIKIEPDLTDFLRERYGERIRGKRIAEMTKEQKYSIAKREAHDIMDKLNMDDPKRKMLLEGMLLLKKNPEDMTLLNMVTESARESAYPDLIAALAYVTITYPKKAEQLSLRF